MRSIDDLFAQFSSFKMWNLQDCKKPVSGKSFYAMEGKPVCPKCVGVDDDEEEEEEA